jgi:hypothetical protein
MHVVSALAMVQHVYLGVRITLNVTIMKLPLSMMDLVKLKIVLENAVDQLF